jgi:hypothetical protein
VSTDAEVCCKIGQAEDVRKCTRGRRRDWDVRERCGLTDSTEIKQRCSQRWRIPTRNSFVLEAIRVKERKREEGGVPGAFIGGLACGEG